MGAGYGSPRQERSPGQEVRSGTRCAGLQPLSCLQIQFAKELGDGGVPFLPPLRGLDRPVLGVYYRRPLALPASADGCLGFDSFYNARSLTPEKEPWPGWESIITPYLYRMFLLLLKYFLIQHLTAASRHACGVGIIIPILYTGKQSSAGLWDSPKVTYLGSGRARTRMRVFWILHPASSLLSTVLLP